MTYEQICLLLNVILKPSPEVLFVNVCNVWLFKINAFVQSLFVTDFAFNIMKINQTNEQK